MGQGIRYTKPYPRHFGYMLSPPCPPDKVEGWEVGVLKELRDLFAEREGEILSWKNDLAPLGQRPHSIRTALERLWKAGDVLKFAKSFHTQSGRPQYIQWYIWEEV